ncbi:MAG: hypothetical protein KBA61_18195 [Spirochaetes bacterium]|nr:hypothetical protein [Spirochaetota bacterium]
MRCDTFIQRYTALDNLEKPGPMMRLHALRCDRCRAEASRMDGAARLVRTMEPDLLRDDLTTRIMAGIRFSGTVYGRKVSIFNWVSAEILLLAALVLVQFSEPRIWLVNQLGRGFEMALSVSLGVLITLFSALLVGTHMKELNGFRDRLVMKMKK